MNNILNRRWNIPGLAWLNRKVHSLSLTGKLVFGCLAFIFIISAIALLLKVNNAFLVEVPRQGGTLTEGVVGLPRFANPLLAVTDGDKDLVSLIYSGLMRQLPDGTLIPDLADHYTISADGKTYDFVLKQNATFHDGSRVTADDVVYTIQEIGSKEMKNNSKQTEWDGVNVAKVNDHEVMFTLVQPYAPFLGMTTLGILPKHLFAQSADMTSSKYNVNPVGSGPYKLSSIEYGSNGVITGYKLSAFNNFVLGKPGIGVIDLKFYDNEENLVLAYENADVDDINSISPEVARQFQDSNAHVIQASLPRSFAVFFNQSANPALADNTVRQALDLAVDRGYIIDTVLHGYGTPLQGPVPQRFTGAEPDADRSWVKSRVAEANALLDKNGWVLNSQGIREKKTKTGTTTLAFSLSTSDAPELTTTAGILKDEWSAIGADVTVKVVEGGYLNQNIIRPRKYDSLLFGEVVNRDLDLYAFWHSSEVSDPGLNVALFSDKKADQLLESMRIVSDKSLRERAYAEFAQLVTDNHPAVFLFSPTFIYVVSPDIKNISVPEVGTPSDRFGAVYKWYIETDKIWKIFAHNNSINNINS